MVLKKTFRYWWWLTAEFLKKHIRLIAISFFITFVFLVGMVSIYPYLEVVLPQKKEIIGIVGNYDLNNPPEEIINKISNGVFYLNEKGELISLLVKSWEKKDEGLRYRFYLKDNILWDDGKKFTADDINYQFKDISSTVIDEGTIDFFLSKSLAIFPIYLTKPLLRYPLIGVGGFYRVTNLKTKSGYLSLVTLSPQKKGLTILVYKFYNNENQMITAYKKGEITKMIVTKKTIAQAFTQWNNTKITQSVDYSRLLTLFYNGNNEFLQHKDVKQAISMAINLNNFIELGVLAKGPISPISWAYNPNLKNPVFNPEAAEKIIKKSISATDSPKLNLVTYYAHYDVADYILTDLQKIGLTLNLNIISSDKPKNFDLFLAFWKLPRDPDQYYFWHSTQTVSNISHYKNVKVDKLLEEGRSTLDFDKRLKIYWEFQRIIQDDLPAVFLFFPYIYTIERR